MQYEFLVGTVRFNNKTYLENHSWKQRKKYKGCAYGLDKPLCKNIPIGKYIYIIEMNNDINKIMGIGKIKNKIIYSNRTRMYKEEGRNQFVYKSKHFISRNDIINNIPKARIVIKFLENILFYGSKHFKRGQGCVILPWNRITTAGNVLKTQKRNYRCKICGLKIKNHICPGRRVKIIPKQKKCHICGKSKKGHICQQLKKNVLLEKFIIDWFNNLF